jgi:uncharacterized protein (TIGR02453 family)
MPPAFKGFPPETLSFLRKLERHNDRAWFLAHKEVYEAKVRKPMVELVLALGSAVQSFAPEMVTDPKRSIYRIYRDTRFSADKRPYKTHIADLFWPRGLPKHAGAGLYFHIAPEEILIGGGIYMPGAAELRAIRPHIANHWKEMRKIVGSRNFNKLFGSLEGEQLARVPREFPPDHPAADLLRYKQYLAGVTEPPALAASPRLFPRILVVFAALMPLVRFLNTPLRAPGQGWRAAPASNYLNHA